jgi:hypothetical protein
MSWPSFREGTDYFWNQRCLAGSRALLTNHVQLISSSRPISRRTKLQRGKFSISNI